MKVLKTAGALGIAGFAAVCASSALAADSGWYGGFGVGWSEAGIHNERIAEGLQASGLTMDSISGDDSDFGFKVFAGHKFNPNFALEGGYFNLGEFGFNATTTPAGTYTGAIKFQGLNLDALAIVPFSDRFSVLLRAGLTYTEGKNNYSSTGAVTVGDPNPKKREANYKLGVGVQYDFTDSLGMRGEWERYRVNDAVGNDGDVDLYTLGLVYTFGTGKPARTAAAPPAAAAPAPVAAAPIKPEPAKPEPVQSQPAQPAPSTYTPVREPVQMIVVPVLARSQQYCSILDIQFEINQNTVQRETEEKIDKVVTFMRKYPDTTAVIEGHTDEVGNSADNLRLSRVRAQNVVAYMTSRGIARSRLQALGYGEARPIADNKSEIGRRLNRRINAIIACATDIAGIEQIPARITMAMEMEFDVNRAEVKPEYREELRKVANFLKANPGVTAAVEGHASDQQATPEKSMQLSQQRAQNVVNALVVQFGVSRNRLSAAGFGETRRFAYNTSAEGRQENRRVNIILDFPARPAGS